MRQISIAFALLASLALAPLAQAYTSPGAARGYVNDFAGVLSPATKQALEVELGDFDHTTSNQIAVAIVPDMGGDYLENYAVKLFEEWKIGTQEKDNGVLLLVAIAEHKLRIEVGYGLEGALPDSLAQRILDNEMTPKLKAGDYDGAVTAGVRGIEAATKGEYVATKIKQSPLSGFPVEGVFVAFFMLLQVLIAIFARSKSWWAGGVVGFVGGLLASIFLSLGLTWLLGVTGVLTVLGALFDYVVSKGYQDAKIRGIAPPWWAGGAGIGRGVGGFRGFGGGRSGGGGASGGW